MRENKRGGWRRERERERERQRQREKKEGGGEGGRSDRLKCAALA